MTKIADIAAQGQALEDQRKADLESPLFTPKDTGVGNLLDTDPPIREFLLVSYNDPKLGVLPHGVVGSIIGPGGVAKSLLSLHIAIAVATKTAVAGGAWKAVTEGKVLCLYAEDDMPELHRRLHDIVAILGLSKTAIKKLRRNLHIRSMAREDTLLTEKTDHEVHTTTRYHRLRATAEQYRNLKLIIIDPVSRFRGGEENLAQDTTRFMVAIEQLSKATGATILMLHHTNKASANGTASQHAARGSSAFVDANRWVMNLAEMSDKQAEDFGIDKQLKRYYINAQVTKTNYTPPQSEEIWLHREQGGVLVRENLYPQVSRNEFRTKYQIQMVVKDAVTQGTPYTVSRFARKYGAKDGPLGMGRNRLSGLLSTMLVDGSLIQRAPTEEESKHLSNTRLVLDCDRPPPQAKPKVSTERVNTEMDRSHLS